MKTLYLILAVLGTIVPWYFFGRFFAENGIDFPLFLASLSSNNATHGFVSDILISVVVFFIWSWRDARDKNVKHWWVVLPTTCCIGLSLSLPLYLFLRERA